MNEPKGIIHFASSKFLMWAEPDEGSYNWKMYRLCSRYGGEDPVIPKEIADYVLKNSSEYYPIAIIDGWHLEGKFDIRGDRSSYITRVEREDLKK